MSAQREPPRYRCRHIVDGAPAHGVVSTRAWGKPLWSLQLHAQLCEACTLELLEVLELTLERLESTRNH